MSIFRLLFLMTETEDRNPEATPTGLVLHAAALYDLTVWLMTLGREQAFRERLLRLARLKTGESVLDVGCGTGTLAIAAKGHVGPTGSVCGIDASPEMVARAERKAKQAGANVDFKNAAAQALPFPDARFDVVLSTVMLHHLSRRGREQCAREMSRVVRPGGRVLAVDFGGSALDRSGLLARFHRHGRVDFREITDLLGAAGLDRIESGAVGIRNLQFVLAEARRTEAEAR